MGSSVHAASCPTQDRFAQQCSTHQRNGGDKRRKEACYKRLNAWGSLFLLRKSLQRFSQRAWHIHYREALRLTSDKVNRYLTLIV